MSLDLDGVREPALRNARPYHCAPATALAGCRDPRAVIGLVTVLRGFAGARVALRALAARPDRPAPRAAAAQRAGAGDG